MDQIVKIIENNTEKYIHFLCDICSFEARAYDKEVLDRMVDYIAAFAQKEGFHVTRTPMEKCGDFLTVEIYPGAKKCALLMAHMDTVHEKGVFGQPAVQVYEDRIVGPGVIDCKGGITIALLCMKALLESGYDQHVRLILTSDEEISNVLGGEKERQFFQERVAGFPCAINCETAEGDQVVIKRKATLKYRLDVHGVSGHSGKRYFESKNAILEAAHKIIALEQSSASGGTTYSCNVVQGGKVLNIIPDCCSISVDIRAETARDVEIAMNTVEQIAQTSFVSGTSCDVTLLSTRPPMEKQPQTEELLKKLLCVCEKYHLGTLTPMESGGGSDSCYTQGAGVPSICGMGASGGLQHTPKEYLNKASIPLRAKILAGFAIMNK